MYLYSLNSFLEAGLRLLNFPLDVCIVSVRWPCCFRQAGVSHDLPPVTEGKVQTRDVDLYKVVISAKRVAVPAVTSTWNT